MTTFSSLFIELSTHETNTPLTHWRYFCVTQLLLAWKRAGDGRIVEWDTYLSDEFVQCIVPNTTAAQVIQFMMGVSLQRAVVNDGKQDTVVTNSIWNSLRLVQWNMFLLLNEENEYTQWWKTCLSTIQDNTINDIIPNNISQLWWDHGLQHPHGVEDPNLKGIKHVMQYPLLDQYIRWCLVRLVSSRTIERAIHQFYLPNQFHSNVPSMLLSFLETLSSIPYEATLAPMYELFRSYATTTDGTWLLTYLSQEEWGDTIATLDFLFSQYNVTFLPMNETTTNVFLELVKKHSDNEHLLLLMFRWMFQMRNEDLIEQLTNNLKINKIVDRFQSVVIRDWFRKFIKTPTVVDLLDEVEVLPTNNVLVLMTQLYDNKRKCTSTPGPNKRIR
jgi:hypothetical protein